MDLSQIKPVERVLEVLHPKTKKPVGMRLTLCCGHDDRVKSVVRKQRDADVQRKGVKTMAEREAEAREVLAACVTGVEFDEGCDWGGKTEYSADLAKEIVSVDWLADQVNQFGGQTEDFFEA